MQECTCQWVRAACWTNTLAVSVAGWDRDFAAGEGGAPGLCRVDIDALDTIRPLEERALQAGRARCVLSALTPLLAHARSDATHAAAQLQQRPPPINVP